MKTLLQSWQFWAVLSAAFAAATAILAKVGVARIDANFATLIRTVVILFFIAAVVTIGGGAQPLESISRRTWIFLVLSGLATGVSWLCYFRALQLGPAAQVAPIDKLSVVLVAVLGVALLGETLSIRNWIGVAMIAAGAVLVGMTA